MRWRRLDLGASVFRGPKTETAYWKTSWPEKPSPGAYSFRLTEPKLTTRRGKDLFGITWFKGLLHPVLKSSPPLRNEVLTRIEAFRFSTAADRTPAQSVDADQHEATKRRPPAS